MSYCLADEICLGLSRGQGNEIHINTIRRLAAAGQSEIVDSVVCLVAVLVKKHVLV